LNNCWLLWGILHWLLWGILHWLWCHLWGILHLLWSNNLLLLGNDLRNLLWVLLVVLPLFSLSAAHSIILVTVYLLPCFVKPHRLQGGTLLLDSSGIIDRMHPVVRRFGLRLETLLVGLLWCSGIIT
jgi:hypothetical protein